MNHHFNAFTVILTVSFALYGVFSPITEPSLIFKDDTASIYTRRMESSARRRFPHCFLLPLLHVFLICVIDIKFIPIFLGSNNHLTMWAFQEVTPLLHPSARCLPFRTSLKAFLSSKGSMASDLFIFLRASVLHFTSSVIAAALRATPNLRLGRGFSPNYLRKVSFYSAGRCRIRKHF